jgi:hypothetical protein
MLYEFKGYGNKGEIKGSQGSDEVENIQKGLDIYLILINVILSSPPPPSSASSKEASSSNEDSSSSKEPSKSVSKSPKLNDNRESDTIATVISLAERCFDCMDPLRFLSLLPKGIPLAKLHRYS